MASFVGSADLILMFFSIREGPMETETFSTKSQLRVLLDHLAAIKDMRQSWKVAYPLREVLFLVVCGTIASGDDYDDIVDYCLPRALTLLFVSITSANCGLP